MCDLRAATTLSLEGGVDVEIAPLLRRAGSTRRTDTTLKGSSRMTSRLRHYVGNVTRFYVTIKNAFYDLCVMSGNGKVCQSRDHLHGESLSLYLHGARKR